MNTKSISKLIDVTLKHSFQIVLSLALIVLGARGFITGFERPIPFVNDYPTSFLAIYFTLAMLAGLCSFFGLYLGHKSFWWVGVERFGLYLAAPAWGSYAIVTFVSPHTPQFVLEFFLFFSISIACLLHADSVRHDQNKDMEALREQLVVSK